MFYSTAGKGFPSLSLLIKLTMVLLLALAVTVTCVSCGGESSDHSDKSETGSDTEVETTATKADLTREMYDSIELGMTYDQVLDIIGQAPNDAEEVEDEMRPDESVLKCVWNGKEGSSEYPENPRLEVYFSGGEVSEKASTSL
ncbi:MAG: hypothetical protein JXA49_03500 [Actinobacteria bacterium]|nr:hypothetical protein [Actinomycetota bacterium]